MAKLADALDLGSSALRHGGSSPFIRTILIQGILNRGYFLVYKMRDDRKVNESKISFITLMIKIIIIGCFDISGDNLVFTSDLYN